jgi:hypothetical protein
MPQTCIWDVLGSNLSQYTHYLRLFILLSPSRQITASLQLVSNSPLTLLSDAIKQSFSTFSTHSRLNKALRLLRHTINFLSTDFIIMKTSNKIVFKRSIAKILIIVLFSKIMLIMDFDKFLFLNFFSLLFNLPPNSSSTLADPLH